MGLLQKAVETYNAHISLVGQYRDGKAVLAPVSHIVTSANLEITIADEGRFVTASAVDKTEGKIVIPVTGSSAGRTNAPCAHPLCDQLGYLIPRNEIKYKLYIDQLSDWEASPYTQPKLTAILRYVQGGTILNDLLRSDLIKLDSHGLPENEKLLVRWRVLGDGTEACWADQDLFQSFIRYYATKNEADQMLCMVNGNTGTAAGQHPKGIIPINGNAKLISANDSSGFTYRGRFSEEWQAASVGYEASQKAHNALRWLAQEQGVIFGGRTFLCWNPQGKTITPNLTMIVSFSYAGASPALMGACAERDVGLAFCTPRGKFLARVSGISRGNVLLRRTQYRCADDPVESCRIARSMIFGKVYNARWSTERTRRDHKIRIDAEAFQTACGTEKDLLPQILEAADLESLRGLEGQLQMLILGSLMP